MNSEVINKYITKRYSSWLDYAKYHCSHCGKEDEATDVLNEVLIMLLEKCTSNKEQIERLYESKKGEYRELDFFILQMIKLNITSETSPYQFKYRHVPIDLNTDIQFLEIIDEEEAQTDRAGEVLIQMQKVRKALEELLFSEKAKEIFYYKFFLGEDFTDWPGEEDIKFLYESYNKLLELVKDKIKGNMLF